MLATDKQTDNAIT